MANFKYIKVVSYEMIRLPNGKIHYVDNVRYGGNGFLAWEKSQGKCVNCGTYENLCLHHNNGFSNKLEDLIVLCRKCHKKLEVEKKYGGKTYVQ